MDSRYGGSDIHLERIKQELFLLPKLADELYDSVPEKVTRTELALLVLLAAMRGHLVDSISLVRAGVHSTLPIILRSSIDTFADLLIVLKEPRHVERFLLQKNENRLAWLKVKLNPLKGVDGDIDAHRRAELVSEKASLEDAIKSSKERGLRKLSVKEKYKLAGIFELYENAYDPLSAYVHGDFDIASKKYIEFTDGSFRHIPNSPVAIDSDERKMIPLMCLNFSVALSNVADRLRLRAIGEKANQAIVRMTAALEGTDGYGQSD